MKTKYGELRDYSREDMLFGLEEKTKVNSLNQSQSTLLPWCPLFGELPYNSQPWTCQISKAVDTIHNARLLWDIESRFYTPSLDELIACDSWAESEDLQPFYPKDKLLLARNLFIEWDYIRGQIVKYRKSPYRYEEVSTPHSGMVRRPIFISDDLSQTPGDAIIYWFKKLPLDVRFKKIEAWQIFSILSIYEARKVLNISLYSGFFPCYYYKAKWELIEKYEKDPDLINQNQIASDLLSRAELPDRILGAQRRKEQHRFGKKGAQLRAPRVDARRNEWLRLAQENKARHKNWNISRIATEVRKKMPHPQRSHQTIYRYLLKEKGKINM